MIESSDEFENWKENTPFLYDTLLTHVLEWASLSVEILPQLDNSEHVESMEESSLPFLIGTHTSEKEENLILVLDVLVPSKKSISNKQFSTYNDYAGFGFGSTQNKFRIRQVFPHPSGEPNRIRSMPQMSCIVASISSSGLVTVLKLNSDPNSMMSDETKQNSIRLTHHDQEGWALDWSKMEEGKLATGGNDQLICLWDVQGPSSFEFSNPQSQHSLNPTLILRGHTAPVQDVAWHPVKRDLLFSTGDDGTYKLWDLRSPSRPQIDHPRAGGGKALNAIAVNKYRPELFCTGGEEQDIVLWDWRNPSEELYRLTQGHTSCISRVCWGNSERYLASCAADRFVLLWDLYAIGKDTNLNETEEAPSELMFTHAGHTDSVYDFSWNRNEDESMMLASVSQDNELHIWKPCQSLLESDESDFDDMDDGFEVE